MTVDWHEHSESTACIFTEDVPNMFAVAKWTKTIPVRVGMNLNIHARVEGNCLLHMGRSTVDKPVCMYTFFSSSFFPPLYVSAGIDIFRRGCQKWYKNVLAMPTDKF